MDTTKSKLTRQGMIFAEYQPEDGPLAHLPTLAGQDRYNFSHTDSTKHVLANS